MFVFPRSSKNIKKDKKKWVFTKDCFLQGTIIIQNCGLLFNIAVLHFQGSFGSVLIASQPSSGELLKFLPCFVTSSHVVFSKLKRFMICFDHIGHFLSNKG